MKVEIRYWDADAFLGWLKEEADKVNDCREVLEEAEAGRILIATSAITLTEVIKMKKKVPIEREHAQKIKEFFQQEFISVRNVDRYIAEKARDLIWDYSFLKPKDSIHVATAVRFEIPLLNTFDGDLIKLSGKIGNPPLIIERPGMAQRKLALK